MTNKISYLNDGEFCIIKKNQIEFFDETGKKVNKEILELSLTKKIMIKVTLNIYGQRN